MGEYAESLCDVDARDDEAAELKQRLLAWLVDKCIVEPDVTDCVLSDEGGHRPAPTMAMPSTGATLAGSPRRGQA